MAGKATTGPPARAQNRMGINYSKVPECDKAMYNVVHCCAVLLCRIQIMSQDFQLYCCNDLDLMYILSGTQL